MTNSETQTLITLLEKYKKELIASDRVIYSDPTISESSEDLCDIDETACSVIRVLDSLK